MFKLIIFEAAVMGLIFGIVFQSLPAIIAGVLARLAIMLLGCYIRFFRIIHKIIDVLFSAAYGILSFTLLNAFMGGWAAIPAIVVGFGTFFFRWYIAPDYYVSVV